MLPRVKLAGGDPRQPSIVPPVGAEPLNFGPFFADFWKMVMDSEAAM
jgi:hypothetical protein